MSGNGDAQRLESLEKAITGTQPMDPLDDVVSRVNRAADQCRAIAHEGKIMEEMSMMFASHLEKLMNEYHMRMRERVAELEQMLGKIGGSSGSTSTD